jgi:hypothetical protein
MKNKWLNLVLLLTNKIYNKKQFIINQAGLGAVYNIFVLILLEIFLGIISLPLYLSLKSAAVVAFFEEKGAYAKINFDYNLRRVLTLTGVAIVASIWVVKLSLILFLPSVYGPLPLYSITNFRPADILFKDLVIAETGIQTARIMKTMPRPELLEVKKKSGGDFVFSGKGQPNSTVVLLLSDKQTAIYTAPVDAKGNWQVQYLHSKFKLSDGNHSVIVFGYEEKLGVRSETGMEQFFKVKSSWLDNLVKNVDVLANWSVVIIIIFGIFLTVLTI